jgi:VWFA-related protein
LQAGDFKLFDNKQPQSLLSVQAANGTVASAAPPVEAIVVIDDVNPAFLTVANERQWIVRFLSENDSHLALPTSLVILTDKGIRMTTHPTHDGIALAQFLNANPTGFRGVRRSEGEEGAIEREQTSLNALDYLAVQATKRPGRKLLIWISPGWRIFSNASWNGGPRDEKIVFNYVVALSTALREARMTIYSIDPAGEGRGEFFYMNYLKGADEPKHVDYGDLFLQVLATQSGGQVLFGNNDLASLIDRCIRDAASYYVITYKPPTAGHANEYHALEVQVDRPGVKVRTRTGYYAQPTAATDQPFPGFTAQK